MVKLVQFLERRSPVVHVMSPDQSVSDAVEIMTKHQVGAVPIVERERLIGIFSERDLLRRVVGSGRSVEKTRLRDVMTPDPTTAEPGERGQQAVAKMLAVGCRHLPILVEGQIIDMLSMRDLLFREIEEQGAEIKDLKRYIAGSI